MVSIKKIPLGFAVFFSSSRSSAQLKALCQQLYEQLKTQESSRYDLEFKVRKQDYDVNNHQH